MRDHSRRTAALTAALGISMSLVGCGLVDDSGGGGAAGSFERPVELVAPFGPGGGSDQVARAMAQAMAEPLDTDIPVVNVPGATGSTGMTEMLSSRPGEAMAVLIQDTLATVSAGGAAFETDELRAVCRVQSMPSALLVRKGTFQDWEELLAGAKDAAQPLTVATVGSRSVDDVVLGAVEEVHGAPFRAVPYSEPTERYTALLSGEVDVLYEQLGDVRQYLDSGDFVPVVLLSEEPVEGLDDVPLATDVDLPPEVVLPQFRGLVVDADTSDEIVDSLASACEEGVGTDDMSTFQEQVYADGDSYLGPDEFQTFLEDQESLIATQLDAYGVG